MMYYIVIEPGKTPDLKNARKSTVKAVVERELKGTPCYISIDRNLTVVCDNDAYESGDSLPTVRVNSVAIPGKCLVVGAEIFENGEYYNLFLDDSHVSDALTWAIKNS